VCPQPFDTALQTTTAQQIRLLQAQGVVNPKLRTLFISEIICKIKTWRQAHYDILLCMDANENTDNPKAKISRLFQETDFLDLHHHRYPGHCKPATQQQGCHPIDIMVGSLCVTEALIHAWIRLFGHPATIKGDHHLLGIDLDPEVLFGNATTLPMTHIPRGVNSRYPQKVTKFCKKHAVYSVVFNPTYIATKGEGGTHGGGMYQLTLWVTQTHIYPSSSRPKGWYRNDGSWNSFHVAGRTMTVVTSHPGFPMTSPDHGRP